MHSDKSKLRPEIGTDRESCNNCFYRTIDDCDKDYCIKNDITYKEQRDTFFMVCKWFRYEFTERPRAASYDKRYHRKIIKL